MVVVVFTVILALLGVQFSPIWVCALVLAAAVENA